ncbi:D-mannonate oxidoreductase [Lewinellaceae bacterium SD302]|nr:D-mannonate oxidoreductase [Lewinellaceae bacterium SD302]
MSSLANKVAVVTGGNGTLGNAFVRALSQTGARVFILGRNEEKSAKVVADFAREGLTIEAIRCDVLEEEQVNAAVDTVLSKAGRVDILVNGAGGNRAGATVGPDSSIFELGIDDFRKVNDLNLLGTVIPSIAFAKPMVEQGSGCIVNISSMAALLPISRVVGYSAAKAAVDNFTRWLAVELAAKYGEGIRVNAIAPGFFIAEQNRRLLTEEDGSLTSRGETIISQTPLKRFGEPEELMSTLLWLCDDRSSFVNGIVVPVDGGFSAFCGV